MNVTIHQPQTVIIAGEPATKPWLRRWQAFGLTFAIAKGVGVKAKHKKWCKPNAAINGQRKTNLMAKAHKKKPRLYEQQEHRCAICRNEFQIGTLQIHHKAPLHYFPELGAAADNLLLVCPECHRFIHSNPLLMSDMIRDAARHFGIEYPERRYDYERGKAYTRAIT